MEEGSGPSSVRAVIGMTEEQQAIAQICQPDAGLCLFVYFLF